MMVLGLVELALNTKRCSEWDYIKKEGTKSCWDRPGAGLGETEITDCSTDSDGPRVGTRVPFAIRSTERSPAKPNRNGRRSKQTPRARPQIRPRGLNHNHRERRERNRGVLSFGRDSCALSRSYSIFDQVPNIHNDATQANVTNRGAFPETWKKHAEKLLESA